jgi:hypothetical protein
VGQPYTVHTDPTDVISRKLVEYSLVSVRSLGIIGSMGSDTNGNSNVLAMTDTPEATTRL